MKYTCVCCKGFILQSPLNENPLLYLGEYDDETKRMFKMMMMLKNIEIISYDYSIILLLS
jgi:type I restriction-modification system DNA methylase subunit